MDLFGDCLEEINLYYLDELEKDNRNREKDLEL